MLLITHVIIATTTLILSLFAVARPSKTVITNSKYASVATLVSGVVLLTQPQVSIARACVSGIAVITLSTILITVASKKYAAATVRNK